MTTFHGLGLRIVREQAARLGLGEDVRVVDEAERLALAREAMGADAPAREVRRLLDHVSSWPATRPGTTRSWPARWPATGPASAPAAWSTWTTCWPARSRC